MFSVVPASFSRDLPERFYRKSWTLLIALLLLFGGVITPGPVQAAPAQRRAVPDEYLIKLTKPRAKPGSAAMSRMHAALGVSLVREHKLTGSQLVRALRGRKLNTEYAKRLLADGTVEYIEPNYVVSIKAAPNDTKFSELWGLHNTGQTGGRADVDIDAPEAWELTTGSSDVVVGIVDTGVFYTHPDLAANMWRNPAETPGNGVDDDGNGVVDDYYGFNAITRGGDPLDDHGHGSHTAGTIGGAGNNAAGVVGVNWNVRIMALKFLDAGGFGSLDDAIAAIEYAVAMKRRGVNIRVLNNSWGGGDYSAALEDAIRSAGEAGILFVAAAGNESSDNDSVPAYPANYDLTNVLSVAAIDHDGNLASFSNYGANSVHLAAPGVDILSTVRSGLYQQMSGTSMATPHAAGVAALVLSREPALSASELRSRLMATVKPLDTLVGSVRSPGIVSALNALTNARTPSVPDQPLRRYESSRLTANYDAALGARVLDIDDGYFAVDLPFAFPYYGVAFPRLAISTNGRVLPLAASQAAPEADDYRNSLSQGICVYHDDLFPSPLSPNEGGVWYKADANGAVITWVSVYYGIHQQPAGQDELRFQLKLFPSGRIEFHYHDLESSLADRDFGAEASVGLAAVAGVSGEKLTITHNAGNEELASGRGFAFTLVESGVRNDYDGDGRSDVIVWRPGTGWWYVLTSGSGWDFSKHHAYQLGLPGDMPLTGDFDGDHRTDFAVWRPGDGTWYFRTSASDYGTISSVQWGLAGDVPLVGDYDGDGISDIAVSRASAGAFYVLLSSGSFNREAALRGDSSAYLAVALGGLGNDPVVGDFNGDGRDDFATVWQLLRFWTVKHATGQLLWSLPWGEPGDTPLACDWDGDGTSDRFIVRIAPGNTLDWFGAHANGQVTVSSFGSLGDVPACTSDYDGDQRPDQRLFRPQSGEWYIRESASGETVMRSFGLPGDIAL